VADMITLCAMIADGPLWVHHSSQSSASEWCRLKKLRGFSPRANYTYRHTASCQRG
jgi:hypothetical protein